MRKLFAIFCLIALSILALIAAGEKQIVGVRVNNQLLLLRVDMANYAMDCSTDGTNWSAIPGTYGEFIINDNDLSLAKLVQIPTASILGNLSGSTGNVTTLSVSDIKTLIGDATTSVSGLMSSTDKTTLGSRAASGANSDITSLTGLTTALSVTQGGTGLNSLGTAGQVLTVNSGATGYEFTTPSSGSGSGDVTGPSSSTDGNLAAFDGATGKIIKDSGVAASAFATAGANSNITSMTGLTTALSVAQGGTGATSAANARTSLSAASSGANSDITSLTGLTTALSVTQGGTGLSALGTAGQVLTVNSGATALEFITPTSGGASAISDLTDVSLTSLATGNGLVYEVGTGTTLSLSHFNDSLSDEVDSGSWTIMSGVDSPTYATGKFSNAAVFNGNSGIYNSAIPHLYNLSTFTLEGWFYPTGYGDLWVMGVYDEVGLSLVTGHLVLSGTGSGLTWGQIGSTGTTEVSLNTWSHIRIVRSGENFYVYLNGTLEISGALTMRSGAPSTTRYLSIGSLGVGLEGVVPYTGRVDELRLLDEALIGDFTPATEPYTVPSGVWKNQMIIASPASPAQGDILYYTGSAWAKLAAGTSGQYLQTQGESANPLWATVTGTGGLLKSSGSGYALENGSTGRGTVGTKSVSLEYSSSGSGYGATGNSATVGGGTNNTASATNSTVSGGSGNAASEIDSTVAGGYLNTASGNKATVSGGAQNTASGTHSSVSGGVGNTAGGNFSSVIGGESNTASALYSLAGGHYAYANHYGGFAWGTGQFSALGDCQKGFAQARVATSSTDATILYLDGSSEKFTLNSGDHYSCRIHVLGAQADGSTGDYYALVKIKNASGTTSLSGTVRVLEAWEGDANLGTPTIAITADDTNDCLQIAVTPANSTATRWSATIDYIKINY